MSEFASRAKAAWARLIRKVYEVDPLECPKCKGPMRIIALIDDPRVIRRILEHLGLWAPETSAPGPPAAAYDWPVNAHITRCPTSPPRSTPCARPGRGCAPGKCACTMPACAAC